MKAQEPSSAAPSPSGSSCSSRRWCCSPSASQVSSDRIVDEEDVDSAGVTGTLATQIDTALEQPNATRWVAVVAGAFGMALAGRTLSRVMVAASCLSWRQPVRIKASPRLIGALVGLLFGMALISTVVNRVRTELGRCRRRGLVRGGVLLLRRRVGAAVASCCRNPPTIQGCCCPAPCLVALVLSGLQAVSQLVLPDQFDRASQLYGAIGTTLVTLGWFFILGRTVVFSMSLDAVIYERLGSITSFVFSLPLLRKLPPRWALAAALLRLGTPHPDKSA